MKKSSQVQSMNNEPKEKWHKRFGLKFLAIAQKITQTKVISTIMEAFIMTVPITLTATFFLLFAELPVAVGNMTVPPLAEQTTPFWIYRLLMQRLFNLSFGLIGLVVCGAIAFKLTEKINQTLKTKTNIKINPALVSFAAISAYFLLSAPALLSEIPIQAFGAQGMFVGMIVGLTLPWFFWFCYKFNITIRLPKQVPQNISNAFLNIIPMFFIISFYGVFGWIFIHFLGNTFLVALFSAIEPALSEMGGPAFFIVWGAVLSGTFFLGIHQAVWHGITQPLIGLGVEQNADAIFEGHEAINPWAGPTMVGSYHVGGTGGTFAIPFIIVLFAKSKQLKAIGLVALIPTIFNVNEPVLFGVPVILNPIMAVPFLITPIINASFTILFINGFGMSASTVAIPWSMPLFASLPLANQLDPLAFALPWIWMGVSFIIFFPFVLIQDNVLYKKEIKTTETTSTEEVFVDYRRGVHIMWDAMFKREKAKEIKQKIIAQKERDLILENNDNSSELINDKKTALKIDQKNDTLQLLVICVGAASSSLCANSIDKAFKTSTTKLSAKASSTYDYINYIADTDIVVISPQVRHISKDIIAYSKNHDNKPLVFQTKGNEFIDMIKDIKYAKQWVLSNLKSAENKEHKDIVKEK